MARGRELLLRLKTEADTRGVDETGSALDKLGQRAKQAGKIAGAAIAGAAVAGSVKFAEFDTQMREVFTLMPGISERAMESMSADVRELSKQFGVATTDAVPALYQAISAGVPPDNVMTFMETAAKAARGGVTDLETAVDGLSSVVNAYGSEAISADEASDILFTTVRLGKTNMEELSRSLFQVTPVAAQLGIDFEEVGAALATLTAQGTPTRVAATQLRGALAELSKEGSQAFEAFRQATDLTFPQFVQRGGTVGEAMTILAEHADETGTQTTNLFGSIEGGMAAAALSSETGASKMQSAMKDMESAAGASEKAFDTMAGGVGFSFDVLKQTFNDALLQIGEALMPAIMSLLPAIEALIPVVEALAPAFASFGDILVKIAPAIVTVADGIAVMAEAINAVVPAGNAGGRAVDELVKRMVMAGKESEAAEIGLRRYALSGEITAENIAELAEITGLSEDALVGQAAALARAEDVTTTQASALEGLWSVTNEATDGQWSYIDAAIAAEKAARDKAKAEEAAADWSREHKQAALEAEHAIMLTRDAAVRAAEAQRTLNDRRLEAIDPLFAARNAERELREAQEALIAVQSDRRSSDDEIAEAIERVVEAQGRYNAATQEAGENTGAAAAAIRALGEEAGLTEAEIQRLIDDLDRYNAKKIDTKFLKYVGSISGTFPSDQDLFTVPDSVGNIIGMHGGGEYRNPNGMGLVEVGESGRELVALSDGDYVLPASDTRAALSGGSPANRGGSTTILMPLHVEGSIVTEREITDIVRRGFADAARRGDPIIVTV